MTKTILHEALPVIKWTPAMGKITTPGIYDLPIEVYHSDVTDGPSISSSGLRMIEDKSPLHYWDTSPLNPDREPQQDKPYFSLGRAVHTLILGEDGFATNYAVRPEEFPDWRTKAAYAANTFVVAGAMAAGGGASEPPPPQPASRDAAMLTRPTARVICISLLQMLNSRLRKSPRRHERSIAFARSHVRRPIGL